MEDNQSEDRILSFNHISATSKPHYPHNYPHTFPQCRHRNTLVHNNPSCTSKTLPNSTRNSSSRGKKELSTRKKKSCDVIALPPVHWLLALAFLVLLPCVQGTECELPLEWRGEWFQSDRAHLGPVVISRHNFSSSLQCIKKESRSNKYLVLEESYNHETGGKYLCHKCMVISLKHRNVIQYKESLCDVENKNLRTLCQTITGDAMLFSMFRLNAAPVTCPFGGPMTFTYSKNLHYCNHPVSQVDSCADSSRLLLRFQACADVPGSESFEEQLVCLGSWREGVNNYLVGKINNTIAKSDNDRYRCFIYETTPHPDIAGASVMKLAQSADATCQGLISAHEGAKTMELTKVNQGTHHCHFPQWFTNHLHWHTLDYSQSYLLYPNKTSLSISNGTQGPSDPDVRSHTDLLLVCYEFVKENRSSRHHKKQQPTNHYGTTNNEWRVPTDTRWENNGLNRGGMEWDGKAHKASNRDHWDSSHSEPSDSGYNSLNDHWDGDDGQHAGEQDRAEAVQHKRGHRGRKSATIIVHVTVGCRTGYWCMKIHRRADHVVEVETGDLAYRPDEACSPHYWNPAVRVSTTLIAHGEQSRSCGPLGRYLVASEDQGSSEQLYGSVECNANNMPLYSSLNVGCTSHDTLELMTSCPENDITTYQCNGVWDSDGITYVVASPTSRPSGSPRRVCFAYQSLVVDGISETDRVMLTARHDTCRAGRGNPHLSLNATFSGHCAQASGIASSAKTYSPEMAQLCVPLLLVLVRLYHQR